MAQILTLTTDFGLSDYYVGVVKGVILSINPDVKLVDINHGIGPHNVFAAAINIKKSYGFFPEGSIHLVVVDPGVGGERAPIIVKKDAHYFVGPDNGVFSLVCKEGLFEAYKISNDSYFLDNISSSFHARDIFAPVSAHLALLNAPELFGEKMNDIQRIDVNKPERSENGLIGEVLYTDSFGNMITNIRNDKVGLNDKILVDGHDIGRVSKSYSSVEKNMIVAIYGSSGFLEVAANQGRAIDNYNKKPSVEVRS